MTPARVPAAEAIIIIQDAVKKGMRVLGLDGFTVVREGFQADLDLLLDVSAETMSADDAATNAIAFVKNNDRPDVIWEVWVED